MAGVSAPTPNPPPSPSPQTFVRVYGREVRQLLVLALPLVFAQMAQVGMSLVDTLVAGRVGPEALAGIALGSTVFMFVLVAGMGTLQGAIPFVAQARGAGDPAGAGRAARQALWLAAGVGALGWGALQGSLPLLERAGQDPAAVAEAQRYLGAALWGYPAAMLFTALRSFLEGIEDTRAVMVALLTGTGLNLLLNVALVFGRWGFPELGLRGTGVATALVYSAMFAGLLGYVATRHRRYRVLRGLRRPDREMLGELSRVGWPIGAALVFESSLFSISAVLMGLFGAVALAAHQVAIQTAAFTFMIPLGLSLATGVRVGNARGRGDAEAVARAGAVGIAAALAVMVATATVYLLAPGAIVALYLDPADPANRAVVATATTLLGLAGVFQIFDGLQVGALGALRGLKDTRVPMVLALVAYWGVGIPSGVVLAFPFGFGPTGLWYGLVAGLAVAGVLLLVRWRVAVRRLRRTGGDPHAVGVDGNGSPAGGAAGASTDASPESSPRHLGGGVR